VGVSIELRRAEHHRLNEVLGLGLVLVIASQVLGQSPGRSALVRHSFSEARRLAMAHRSKLNVSALFRFDYIEPNGPSPWRDHVAFFVARPELTLHVLVGDDRPSLLRQVNGPSVDMGNFWRLCEAITEEDFNLGRSGATIRRMMRSRDRVVRRTARDLFQMVDPRHNVP